MTHPTHPTPLTPLNDDRKGVIKANCGCTFTYDPEGITITRYSDENVAESVTTVPSTVENIRVFALINIVNPHEVECRKTKVLTMLIGQRSNAYSNLKHIKQQYEHTTHEINKEINRLDREVSLALARGIDYLKVHLAEQLVYTKVNTHYSMNSGDFRDLAEVALENCVTRASIEWKMRTKYFGVKKYAGFGLQRADCEYGYHPKHGDIVMEIGLKAPRQPLTDEQVEAIVYYLHLLTQDDNPIANPPRDPKLDAWVDKEAEMRQAYEDMKDDATNGEL